MNHSLTWTLALPVSALMLGACKKEEMKETVQGVVEAVDQAVDEAISGGKALSSEERAAKLGFVGHLAGDTASVMAIYDAKGIVNHLRGLKIWEFVRKAATDEMGMDPEEMAAEQAGLAAKFLGDEFFIASGKAATEQLGHLTEISKRINYHQIKAMSRAFADSLAQGEFADFESAMSDNAWVQEMARDIGSFMPQIEGAQVPPVLAGVKITDGEAMEMAEGQLRQGLAMAAEAGETVDFEKGGASFSGLLFKGAMLVEQMEAGRGDMDEMFGVEHTDRILAAMKEKNLLVAVGRLDDYLLLYVGADSEACPLADGLASSLAANDQIGYIDGYGDKPVLGFLYGEKGLVEQSMTGSLKEIVEGIRDGIDGFQGLGDTRELVTLLGMIGEREQSVLDLATSDTLGGVISLDQGARFDLFGGINSNMIDYKAQHKLSGLGTGENVLIFGNWVTDAEYEKRSGELVGVLVETAYSLAGNVAAIDSDSAEMTQFREGFKMFEETFRKDLVGLWDGLNTAGAALGNEAAIVVDLNADVPPLPGVPQELVEGGRFIRASLVGPVEERAKLGESWTVIDSSLRAILKSANELGAGDINMLVPTSSEKDSLVTWYFDALAFSDDVKPSVTINDDWFVASTSRTHALDLVAKAGAEAGPTRDGAWFEFDLDSLRTYAADTLKLVDENGEVVITDATDLEEFREQLPRIREGLAALEQFDAITLHDRVEGGRRQITMHFKTR